MTEKEWLESKDAEALFEYFTRNGRRASDRKLRLFTCAVARLVHAPLHPERRAVIEVAEAVSDDMSGGWYKRLTTARESISAVQGWIWCAACSDVAGGLRQTFYYERTYRNTARRAPEIFRDIMGNPFQPVDISETCPACGGCGQEGPCGLTDYYRACHRCPPLGSGEYRSVGRVKPTWITPAALSLAQAAYEERPGRVCEKCDGDTVIQMRQPPGWITVECQECRATGRIQDAALCNDRLSILADALEEAGCPTEETTTEEYESYATCGGQGTEDLPPTKLKRDVKRPYPLLAHLRSPGPHYRGCWALDLVLGRA